MGACPSPTVVAVGGPPTVGDFDSDRRPEIGVASSSSYVVLDTSGTRSAWQEPTVDTSPASPVPRSSTSTTTVRPRSSIATSSTCGSSTALRERSALDPDAFAHPDRIPDRCRYRCRRPAEIVVPSDNDTPLPDGTTQRRGLYAFGSPLGDWVRARPIWNQHSYHVTNVNVDGTIPAVESPNWLDPRLNNYRENAFPQDEISGLDRFTYRVSDGVAIDEAVAYIDIRDPENAPEITCLPPAVATVGYDYRGRVCAIDPDDDVLAFAGAANLATAVEVSPNAHPWLAGQPDGASVFGGSAPVDSPVLAAAADFFAAVRRSASSLPATRELIARCSGQWDRTAT